MAKPIARDEGGAFGVKDLTAYSTMVLSSEGRKGISTEKAFFTVFVAHPEILA